MTGSLNILTKDAGIFLIVWFILTCLTSGTAVPSGIFLPCIIIGCSAGELYSKFHFLMFPDS